MGVMKFFKPGDILEVRGKKFLAVKRNVENCLECSFREMSCNYVGCDELEEEVYFVEVENEK